jgi:hypothetical protein
MFPPTDNESATPVPASQQAFPVADGEQTSKAERILFSRFQRSFFYRACFEHISTEPDEHLNPTTPHLRVPYRQAERPSQLLSLGSPIAPKRLKEFVNKDTVLYIRPCEDAGRDIDSLARDLFMAWYPYRPPLPTHAGGSLANNEGLHSSPHARTMPASESFAAGGNVIEDSGAPPSTKPSTESLRGLPTNAIAYAQLEPGFCAPMNYCAPNDSVHGLTLAELIHAHLALTQAIRGVLDQITIRSQPWQKDWTQGLIHLGAGFGEGFCIHQGPMMLGEERYTGEKRDTRADRKLTVVGQESWVRRGWHVDGELQMNVLDEGEGIEGLVELAIWTEVEGISIKLGESEERVNDEKWLTRVMPMQEAVEGVIRAIGEPGRFESKSVSRFFREEFLEPPQKTEEEIIRINKRRDDLIARIRLGSKYVRKEEQAVAMADGESRQ